MTSVNLNSLQQPQHYQPQKYNGQTKTIQPKVHQPAPASADKAQQLLTKSIQQQLKEVLAGQGIKTDNLNPDEFTPEKVSDRILGFVQLGLQRAKADGADEAKLNSLFEAAKGGIEKGFKEAKELLDGLKLFQGKVEEDANKTLDLLHQGMDKLSANLSGQTATPASNDTGLTQLKAAEYASYERQDSLALEVKTRDGDIIKISFKQNAGAFQASSYQHNSDGVSLAQQRGSSATAGFDISIEGQLSDDEQQALAGLVEQVQGVSERFFGDDLKGAFKAATELGFDNQQLSGFSLDLQRSETSKYAQTYQKAAQPQANSTPIKALINAGNGFIDSFSAPKLQQILDSPRQTSTDLLNLLVQNDDRFQQLNDQLKQQADAALKQLTGGLTDALLSLNRPNAAITPTNTP